MSGQEGMRAHRRVQGENPAQRPHTAPVGRSAPVEGAKPLHRVTGAATGGQGDAVAS